MRTLRGAGVAVGVVALASTSLAAYGASAGSAAPTSDCATVGQGAHGPAVVAIQQLVGAGADGDYGPLTAAAVSRWQRHHHVPATGRVDAATWQALPADVARGACGAPVRGSGVTRSCTVLSVGSHGPAVAVVQRAVGAAADGEFGPVTKAAVQAAQKRAKLRPTGVVRTTTWSALGLTGTPACQTTAGPTATSGSSSSGGSSSGGSSSGGSGSTGSGSTGSGSAGSPAPDPQQQIAAQVAKLAAALVAGPGTTANPIAAQALAFATAQKGKPYQWGAAGPKAYDCSGLVLASYLHAGLTLPRVAADQYAAGGPRIPLDQAQQGDLLFYASDLTDPSTIYHVVIYAGNGQILDAPYTGAFVGTRPLWTSHLLPIAVRPVAQLHLPVGVGSTGATVAQLQQALNRHGAALGVDGEFGPRTARAVETWKAAHDLPASPRFGIRAWLTLGP